MKKIIAATILIMAFSLARSQVLSKFPNETYIDNEGLYKGVSVALDGLPIKPSRTVSFNTNEGSYMNLDLSPDGKTLIFDLLADIYILPVTGGKAKQITQGMAIHFKPVWSPDG